MRINKGWPSAALFCTKEPMTTVLCATSEAYPTLTEDDQALIRPLADRGIQARPAVWSDPGVPWASANAVIIRSCWDYHLRLEEFLGWIAKLEHAKVRVWNPPAILRWNANKIYLRDLERRDVPVVPTLWPEERFPLREKMIEMGWAKAVVKPRVSATAYRTQLVTEENAAQGQALLEDLAQGPGAMVQEFMAEVRSQGEWSLIFFSGRYSHAVIKRPKSGDFRVQHDFGGSEESAQPPAFVVEAANRAVAAAEVVPLYARVDGVERDGRFLLMELELLEPALFLKSADDAPDRFAEAIKTALDSQ
jgi:glutathione synthase/RimK-type ligase-like ATP-grasp enzyme